GAARVVGELAAAAAGFALGLAPFFVYNWIATGSPLRATQGMEIQDFLGTPAVAPPGVGFPSGAWQSGMSPIVQGGGMRLDNLPLTLPGNLLAIRLSYGDPLLLLALWGIVLAALQRRLLCLVVLPYSVAALLLYSCWARPEIRYL